MGYGASTPLQQAVNWISEEHERNPKQSLVTLADEAGRKFNLTPTDTEFLSRNLKKLSQNS